MDAPTIFRLLGENLAQPLLEQDRDWLEQQHEYQNFGAFYEAWQHAFVVPCSTPEHLAASIVRLYLHRQLSAVVQRVPAGKAPTKDYLRVDKALAGAVAASWPALLSTLQERWPQQWADIVRRNAERRWR
jgi:hypothetical protein